MVRGHYYDTIDGHPNGVSGKKFSPRQKQRRPAEYEIPIPSRQKVDKVTNPMYIQMASTDEDAL